MSVVTENNVNSSDSVASRKLAAAEMRKARKAARESPRNRLFSDSSHEMQPKGILKNGRIPTKRSASECVDDLSQIMADLNLSIFDISRENNYCRHHQYLNEADEDDDIDEEKHKHPVEEDEYDEKENIDNNNVMNDNRDDDSDQKLSSPEKRHCKKAGNLKKCDCKLSQSSDSEGSEKPKKSVRFDEKLYQTFFIASRLYDRRNFARYHLSSRHHPPPSAKQQGKSKKNKRNNK